MARFSASEIHRFLYGSRTLNPGLQGDNPTAVRQPVGPLSLRPHRRVRGVIALHKRHSVFLRISAAPLSAAFDCYSTLPRPLTEPMWGKVGEKWGLMADLRQSPAKSEPRLRSEVLAAALVVGPSSARGGTSGRPGARETLPPRFHDFPEFRRASCFCTNPQIAHRVSPGKCGASDISK